jgi:hypothetical protein
MRLEKYKHDYVKGLKASLGEIIHTDESILLSHFLLNPFFQNTYSPKSKQLQSELEKSIKESSFKGFKSHYEIRQILFKYDLNTSVIKHLVGSIETLKSSGKANEREIVEQENLKKILDLEYKDNQYIVEISPPHYLKYQKYLMLRIYSGMNKRWKVSQYSLHYNLDQTLVAIDAYSKIGKRIKYPKDYLYLDNEILDSIFYFPQSNITAEELANFFPGINENIKYIKLVSQVLEFLFMNFLNKIDRTIDLSIAEILNKLNGSNLKYLEELIGAILLSFQNDEEIGSYLKVSELNKFYNIFFNTINFGLGSLHIDWSKYRTDNLILNKHTNPLVIGKSYIKNSNIQSLKLPETISKAQINELNKNLVYLYI